MKKFTMLATISFLILGLNACSDESQEKMARAPATNAYSTSQPFDSTSPETVGNADENPAIQIDDAVRDHIIGYGQVEDEGQVVFASGDSRFRCRASGPGSRQADLRMENKGGEIRFRAKWEINVGQGQVVGTIVNVAINGTSIGGIRLGADGNQLEGDIEMRGGNIPAAVRAIRAGTPVAIGALRCTFTRD